MRLAIYPGMARCAAGFAIQAACAALKRDGNTAAVRDRMLTPQQYNAALGLGEIEAWEKKYLQG
jgi:2-methylisocitrate lyase-like PEP mutase family enzyme